MYEYIKMDISECKSLKENTLLSLKINDYVQKPTYYLKIKNNSETKIWNLVLRITMQFILELQFY